MMNRMFRYLLLAGALVLTSSASYADTTYYFNYSGSGTSQYPSSFASGSFIANSTGLVTSLTGMYDGDEKMALLAVNTFGSNDNMFNAAGPYFDYSGLSFSADETFYNIYFSNGYLETRDAYGNPSGPISGSISETPEPGSLILFGSGALGLAGFLRRKLSSMNPLSAVHC